MTTPVIFRKWKPRREFDEEGGDIIALFPTELGTNDPYTSSSYEHVGQHGSADPGEVMKATVPATPTEYADLKAELEGIGYDDLKIVKRYQYSYLDERKRKLAGYSVPTKSKTVAKRRRMTKSDSPSGMRGLRG